MTWRTRRVREMAVLIHGYPFDSADFSEAGEVPLVRIRDILAKEFETFVPEAKVPSTALVCNDDVLIGMDGDFNVVLWNRGVAALNQRVCLLRTDERADARFLAYSLPDHLSVINDLTYSTTVKHLSSWQVLHINLEAPDADEQRAIADYLDQETAQIDALVAKQEEFIGLLQERRTAAVAEILNREGNGQVRPDKLHRHVRMGNGSTPRSGENRYYDGGSIPWVNSSVVNHHEVQQASKLVTPVAVAECHLPMVKPGSILVALTGQGKTRGAATISRISTTINQHLAFIEPDIQYWVPEYLLSLIRSKYDHLRRISSENGATKGGLTVGDLRALPVKMPGLKAQIEAVEEIDSAISRIDTLIAKAEEHIVLAKERRSALIAAAVTGQFDVRTAKKGARV